MAVFKGAGVAIITPMCFNLPKWSRITAPVMRLAMPMWFWMAIWKVLLRRTCWANIMIRMTTEQWAVFSVKFK